MNPKILNIIEKFEKNSIPDTNKITDLISNTNFSIDKDFIELYSIYDGMSGELASGESLILWRIEDVIDLNPYYEDIDICKEMLFFGTDGSNFGYAFFKKNNTIIGIDFFDISYKDPTFIANSFKEFLEKKLSI